MAKNKDVITSTSDESKVQVPVRFMMLAEDYKRLEQQAKRFRISKASCAKMLLMKAIEAEEKEQGSK